MPPRQLTTESMTEILGHLDALNSSARAAINARAYAYGSGEPDASLGALRIAYDDAIPALKRYAADIMAGNDTLRTIADENGPPGATIEEYRSEGWYKLATTEEETIRKISGYSEGASIPSKAKWVIAIAKVAGQIADEGLPAIPSLFPKLTIGLIAIVVGLVGFILWRISAAIKSVTAT